MKKKGEIFRIRYGKLWNKKELIYE